MGLFDIFKKKESETGDSKKMVLAGPYLLRVPADWEEREDKKFKMANQSDTLRFVANNYGGQLAPASPFTLADLKENTFGMFDSFVSNNGFEAIKDRETGKDFAYQAFIVLGNTQYYYNTWRVIKGNLYHILLMITESGDYNNSTKQLLVEIGQSMTIPVA